MKQTKEVLRKEYKHSEKQREYWREREKTKKRSSKKPYNPSYSKNYYYRMKDIVFSHYGNKCACCGEEESAFLSIDHINGGGNKHRKSSGKNILSFLIKNNFPQGFQLLCYNCNISKGMIGACPHEYIKILEL